MTFWHTSLSFAVASVLLLGGCATRQVNPPIAKYDTSSLRQVQKQWQRADELRDRILALGYVLEDQKGGTRARRKL